MSEKLKQIIQTLKLNGNHDNVKGMIRFGINSKNMLGVSMPTLRKIGKEIGKNHNLAIELWNTNIHEARIVATLVAEPEKLTKKIANSWVKQFDSWAICDQCCLNLLSKTKYAFKIAIKYSENKYEYVKRTGFALMAVLAVHAKELENNDFDIFFNCIYKESTDERNFVKKAVNWALRQIGKRNKILKNKSLNMANKILKINSKSAKWIAKDAIRELSNKTFK